MFKTFPSLSRPESSRLRLRVGMLLLSLALVALVLPARQASAADPAEVRGQIELTLRAMEQAVLEADQPGYLALCDLSDPVFAQEHTMWAADLGRNRPLKFTLALKDENFEVGDGAAEGDMVMTWTMSAVKNENHLKPSAEQLAKPGKERTLTTRCRFTAKADRWLYAGEVWNVATGDGVRVLYANGLEKPARGVVEVMPEVKAHVHEGFELEHSELPKHTQTVKLYRSMLHLQESIYLSYDDGIGGWNEPGESIKILVTRPDREGKSFKPVLAHEYGHCATFFLGPKASAMPWWALEGVADLSAETFSNSRAGTDKRVRGWARKGELRRWEQLADFRGEAQEHQGFVYTQGHHMVGYISDRFGRTKRTQWLREMANGKSLEEASTAALGMSWEQVDNDWRASLSEANSKEDAEKAAAEKAKADAPPTAPAGTSPADEKK